MQDLECELSIKHALRIQFREQGKSANALDRRHLYLRLLSQRGGEAELSDALHFER